MMTCRRQVTVEIPALTTEQMVEVDCPTISDYGIELILMMENAGCNLAELASRMLGACSPDDRSVCYADAGTTAGAGDNPRPEVAVWIEKANAAGKLVLALDTPSGLDTTSGTADISVPPELYHKIRLIIGNLFENDTIIKVRE